MIVYTKTKLNHRTTFFLGLFLLSEAAMYGVCFHTLPSCISDAVCSRSGGAELVHTDTVLSFEP